MGVGVGAVAFHASSGRARHWGRKLDYWVRFELLSDDAHMSSCSNRVVSRADFDHSGSTRCCVAVAYLHMIKVS